MTCRAFSRRVLMTADTVGGVWTYALELARALDEFGFELALATMGRVLSKEQAAQVHSLRNVQVFESEYKLEWMQDPWLDVQAAGDWLLDLEQRLKPDLIHLNGYAHAALPWRAPRLVVGHSCVLSWWRAVHGSDAPPEWATYRNTVTEGLRAANLVIAPSDAMLRSLQELYGPLEHTMVISNGRTVGRLDRLPKEPFILSAGRLWDAAKNISTLAAIAPELPWPVYVAGDELSPDGSGRQTPNLRRLGRLSETELWPWFARAGIYALPARYEPFGLSALEAALAGCALVLGDIPSLREIWGEAAVYVAPNSPADCTSALLRLINDEALRRQTAARSSVIARRYSPQLMATGYLVAYDTLLERPRPQLTSSAVSNSLQSLLPKPTPVLCDS